MSHRSADRDGLVWRATGDRLVWQEAFGWCMSLGLLGLIGTCVSISEGNLRAALAAYAQITESETTLIDPGPDFS